MTTVNIAPHDLGAFAYLPMPTVTTTINTGEYYPVTGPFSCPVAELFSLDVAGIVFECLHPVYVKIEYSGTFESDTVNTEITTGIKHNGILEPGSTGSFKIKLVGDSGSTGGVLVLELQTGDTLQLVVKSDKSGAKITAQNFSAALTQMFRE